MQPNSQNIDYSKALLQFTGVREHIFKNQRYLIYAFEDKLVMGQAQLDPNPKYVIIYSLNIRIQWLVDRHGQIKSFAFPYRGGMKEIVADSVQLLKLKNLMACKVTFYKISDFFEAQAIIGRGSSAKVLQCKRYEDQKHYAVKSIDKEYFKKDPNGFLAFESEVKILLQLAQIEDNNKYFVKLLEIYEGDNMLYMVTDLMEGKTLQEELDLLKVSINSINKKNHRLMKSENTQIIMRQLLAGLALLHENDIIHRDLKPENIIFGTRNDYRSLKIVDFGLATHKTVDRYIYNFENQRYMYPKCGTPGYVAPEVLNLKSRSDKYSEVCDVFSCGAIFYRILTGKALFDAEHVSDILKKNKECHIDFEREEIQSLTQQQKNLLEAMLQKEPNYRITAKQALYSPYLQYQQNSTTAFIDKNLSSSQLNSLDDLVQRRHSKRITAKSLFRRDDNLLLAPKKPPADIDQFDDSMNENDLHHVIKIKNLPGFKKPQAIRNKLSPLINSYEAVETEKKEEQLSQGQQSPFMKASRTSRQDTSQKNVKSFYMRDPLSHLVRYNVFFKFDEYQEAYQVRKIPSNHSSNYFSPLDIKQKN